MYSYKKQRVWPRVVLGILGVAIVAAVALGVWQRDNIQAFLLSRQRSESELQQMLADNEANTEQILDQLLDFGVRPLTDEEKTKLRSGELDELEAIRRILMAEGVPLSSTPAPAAGSGDAGSAAASAGGSDALSLLAGPTDGSPAPSGGLSAPTDSSDGLSQPMDSMEAKERRIAELTARIYVLRETMTGKLNEILSSAKAEYDAIPEDQRTLVAKQGIAKRVMDKGFALEGSCDAQINEILSELEALLKETGGDASMPAKIRQAYKDEKALKKSYYMSQY